MSWVTTVWGVLIGGCIAIALPFLFAAISQRRAVHLFFVAAVAGTIGIAMAEIAMMHAPSVTRFATALRWVQVPICILVVSIVGFVRLYFGTGRLWLGVTACAVRFVCLVVDFVSPLNLNFRKITALQRLPFLNEVVSTPVGILSPWTHVAELSSLLLLLFVADASISLWRQEKPESRRRALVVGGSITFFIVAAAGLTALIHLKIVQAPYLVSFPFFAIVVAMAFELGYDLFAAAQLAQRLQLSEASLRESETRFQIAADTAPVLIWMAGMDKLCTFFNKRWLDFTGRTMEQEIGNGWSEGVHPGDLEKCVKTYGSAFDARESFVLQYRLRRYDGEYRWITDHGVPRDDAQGNFIGYIGACMDVTELRQKDEALRQFEERVTLATEAAHLGVWEMDTTTNEIWMSDGARALFQFDGQSAIEHATFQSRVHPDDRSFRDAAVKQAIRTQGGYEIEYRALLPNGTVRWIGGRARCVSDGNGSLTRLLGVSMDVTERKQAQELFQLATEASPSGIVIVNDQGRIALVNTQIEHFFGYERGELIGKPVEMLVPERFASERAALGAGFVAASERRGIGGDGQLFARRKDGSEFPVEIGLNPIKTPRGILVLVSVVDISARRLAEEDARHHRDEISRLSRITLVGEMTASIAHELNQPLSGIISNATAGQRFIDRGNVSLDTLREILTDVVADGRRAHDVIRSIRNTIKKGVAFRESMDLNFIVMKAGQLLKPELAAHSCELELALANDLPAIEGDPVQIHEVLINLLSNALDAMRDARIPRRKLSVATERNGDNSIQVSVRDYGTGIPEEVRERLFEQFFTTKEEGLGMGLTIVRSIIETHGGTITAENAEGGGARFQFTLPIAPAK